MRLAKRSKYGAEPMDVDGIRFHSKREARRYCELKLLEKAGEIKDLELQPRFPLYAPERGRMHSLVLIGNYVADFRYREGPEGLLKIEDAKGVRTPLYRWKRKHTEIQYGIKIVEV
jgi:hypothetical protein